VQSEVCPTFFSLGVPGAFALALSRAGLVDVREERIALTLSWPSADEAVEAVLDGGPVALAWKRFAPDVREAVRVEYLASIESYRSGERYEVPSEIVFATARQP
jgi:hypothetical protein